MADAEEDGAGGGSSQRSNASGKSKAVCICRTQLNEKCPLHPDGLKPADNDDLDESERLKKKDLEARAKHTLTEGNSLLGSAELEKLTLLRMNKRFMRFMRENYSHVSQQQFNCTLVKRE